MIYTKLFRASHVHDVTQVVLYAD